MKTTLQILKDARQLISKPENWTQHELARDIHGGFTYPSSLTACSFCSVGALAKVSERNWEKEREALGALHKALEIPLAVGAFNDTHTHEQVLQLFDKAIQNEAPVNS